jgi:putative transposon-encoded protein
MLTKTVKSFGHGSAHVTLPVSYIGKEVDIYTHEEIDMECNEGKKESEKLIVSASRVPDKKVEVKQQTTSKEEFNALMEKVMKNHPQTGQETNIDLR